MQRAQSLAADVRGHHRTDEATRLLVAVHQLEEIAAPQELHRDVVVVVDATQLVDATDVRVVKLPSDARFIDEHADELLVLGDVRKNALDGDNLVDAVRGGGQRLEPLCHSSDADALEQQVFPEGRYATRRGRHRFSHCLGVQHGELTLYRTFRRVSAAICGRWQAVFPHQPTVDARPGQKYFCAISEGQT